MPVLGPVAVPAGLYTGTFIVPRDRPAVLGDPVQVDAFALVGSNIVGKTAAAFTSQTSPAPAVYSFSLINYPTDPVGPGQIFQLSGQILPRPAGHCRSMN